MDYHIVEEGTGQGQCLCIGLYTAVYSKRQTQTSVNNIYVSRNTNILTYVLVFVYLFTYLSLYVYMNVFYALCMHKVTLSKR